MTETYYETVQLIERLHRHFLDVLKVELDRLDIQDINNVQSLILYNIGDDELTIGELTMRGYYLGSNVSYNVKKMVESEYLTQERSVHDKRSVRVSLSDKGHDLRDKLNEMFVRHTEKLDEIDLDAPSLAEVNETLKDMERLWTNMANAAVLPYTTVHGE